MPTPSPVPTVPPQLYTVEQAESITGLNLRHAIFHDLEGFERTCVVRVGRAVRIRSDRLAQWIETRTGAKPYEFSEAWRERNAAAPVKANATKLEAKKRAALAKKKKKSTTRRQPARARR